MTVNKNRPIHYVLEYPCNHCGCVETYCDDEIFDDSWTMEEEDVSCGKCKSNLKADKEAFKAIDAIKSHKKRRNYLKQDS